MNASRKIILCEINSINNTCVQHTVQNSTRHNVTQRRPPFTQRRPRGQRDFLRWRLAPWALSGWPRGHTRVQLTAVLHSEELSGLPPSSEDTIMRARVCLAALVQHAHCSKSRLLLSFWLVTLRDKVTLLSDKHNMSIAQHKTGISLSSRLLQYRQGAHITREPGQCLFTAGHDVGNQQSNMCMLMLLAMLGTIKFFLSHPGVLGLLTTSRLWLGNLSTQDKSWLLHSSWNPPI